MNNNIATAIILFALAAWPDASRAAEWLDWNALLELELGSDDNVNIAPDDFEQDDNRLSLRGGVSRAMMIGDGQYSATRLVWSGDVSRHYYDDWDDLTHTRLGGGVTLQHKFGLGPQAVRLSAGWTSHYDWVRDEDREAWYHAFQVGTKRRFSPRWDLGLALSYRLRDGDDWEGVDPRLGSDVYDSEHYELSLSSGFTLRERLRWNLEASYYDGEFDSDCADLLSPGGGIYGEGGGLGSLRDGPPWRRYDLEALARDQVFACRWLADGDGYGVRTSFVYQLSRNSSVRLAASYRDIELDLGQDYSNTGYSLSYRYRF